MTLSRQTAWIAEGQKVYGDIEHVCSIFVVLLSDGLRSTVPRNCWGFYSLRHSRRSLFGADAYCSQQNQQLKLVGGCNAIKSRDLKIGGRVRSPPPLPSQFVFCDLQTQFLTKPFFLTIRFNSPVLPNAILDSGTLLITISRNRCLEFPPTGTNASFAPAAIRLPV
jgi:hypothetical protein